MRLSGFIMILVLVFAGMPALAQQPDSIKEAAKLGNLGRQLVDKGNLDKAMETFVQGALLDPKNSLFQYEMAVIHYLKKEHKECIQILEEIKGRPDANDQYYQILGNAYDLSGQTAKARKIYSDGIKLFPNSGLLYLESGVLEYMHKNTAGAVRFWEAGVLASPGFTSNYYWLTKYYASTTERIWAVLYGEMFINLERNTERTQELSSLLYRVYQASIPKKDTGGYQVNFTLSTISQPKPGEKLPFEQVFQQTMQQAADSMYLKGTDSLGYEDLCTLRGLFIYYWFKNSNADSYPNIIFEWIHNFPDSSYSECYHRWLFLKGNEERFQTWYYAKPEVYTAFVKWFKRYPLGVSMTQRFSRSQY